METNIRNIIIEKTKTSKISQVDFSNLPFGKVYSDHMLVCDYRDGAWQTPKITPYQGITLDPSAKIFHYGQSVFEGMKAYKTVKGNTVMFRPEENAKRFVKSARRWRSRPRWGWGRPCAIRTSSTTRTARAGC